MIEIKDENEEYLDLYDNTSIQLKLNNPVFADGDIIPGSFTLPFSIPGAQKSPKNARILEHPDIPERRGTKLTFKNRTILYDGVPFKKGDLVINPVSDQEMRGNFLIGLRSLGNKMKNMRLRELMDEQVVMTAQTYSKKVYIKPSAKYWTAVLEFTLEGGKDGNYCIYADTSTGIRLWKSKQNNNINHEPPTDPGIDENDWWRAENFQLDVNEESYEEAYLSDLSGAIDINAINNADASYVTTGSTPLGNFSNPFIEIFPTVDADVLETPFSVNAASDGEADRNMWLVEAADMSTYHDAIGTFVNDYLTSAPDDRFRFPQVINDGLYEDYKLSSNVRAKTKQLPVCNLALSNEIVFNDPNAMWDGHESFLVRNYSSLQPFVKLKYIFDRIKEEFGIGLFGEFFERNYYDEIMVWSTAVCEIAMPYIGYRDFIFFKPSFNIADLVPDWTIEEFLKNLQRKLNLMVYFDDLTNRLIVKSRKPMMLESTYEDLTHISSPNREIDDVSYSGVRLKSETDDDDLQATDDIFEIGEVEEEIITDVSGLEFDSTIYLHPLLGLGSSISLTGPRARQEENSDVPLRLFFLGVPNATVESPFLSMRFAGEDGLYENEYKQYVRFLMNRKIVTFDIDFELRHLLNLDWEKKYMIDRVKYLIKSIDVTLTMTGIKTAKVEMYTA